MSGLRNLEQNSECFREISDSSHVKSSLSKLSLVPEPSDDALTRNGSKFENGEKTHKKGSIVNLRTVCSAPPLRLDGFVVDKQPDEGSSKIFVQSHSTEANIFRLTSLVFYSRGLQPITLTNVNMGDTILNVKVKLSRLLSCDPNAIHLFKDQKELMNPNSLNDFEFISEEVNEIDMRVISSSEILSPHEFFKTHSSHSRETLSPNEIESQLLFSNSANERNLIVENEYEFEGNNEAEKNHSNDESTVDTNHCCECENIRTNHVHFVNELQSLYLKSEIEANAELNAIVYEIAKIELRIQSKQSQLKQMKEKQKEKRTTRKTNKANQYHTLLETIKKNNSANVALLENELNTQIAMLEDQKELEFLRIQSQRETFERKRSDLEQQLHHSERSYEQTVKDLKTLKERVLNTSALVERAITKSEAISALLCNSHPNELYEKVTALCKSCL